MFIGGIKMIDIQKANIEFDKYVSQFNSNDSRIKLKMDHIKRVAMMSKKIAQNLHLDDEQVKLAEGPAIDLKPWDNIG